MICKDTTICVKIIKQVFNALDKHIASKVSTANRNLGISFRAVTYLSQEMFLNLYKSMVRPHLEYASVLGSPLYKKDKATRLILSLKGPVLP